MPVNSATLKAALDRKGTANKCSVCGHANWAAGDTRLLLGALSDDGSLLMGQGLPAVAIVCNHCGFIRLHSSAVLGIQN
jgi:hypothetical protein